MKHERLFEIIYILLEKKVITASELADKLEVSVRTIYRDVDTLSACGIPVYSLSGKNGGISLMTGYTLQNLLLTEKDQKEILFGLQSLQATNQGESMLLSKLSTVFKKDNENWIEVDFSRWGHKKIDSEKFNLLRQSIINNQILNITYLNSSGEESQRNIKPIKLVFKQANWYLQGYCLKAEDFRIFKINRMVSLSLCNEYFTDIFENIAPIDSEELISSNTIDIKLMISATMGFRVYDEFSLDNIKKSDKGSFIVTTIIPFDSWIYSYILSFGDAVEILEPKWLKEEMIKHIEKLEKHFKS